MPKLGNGNTYIINDIDLKKDIINYLYDKIELSKYKYQILNNMEQLKQLKENPHYVSPNFKGFSYFLIFMKTKQQNKTYLIDKKKLRYHPKEKELNLKEIMIYDIKVVLDHEVFDGTIMEGKLINNQTKFIITDCFFYKNKEYTNIDLKNKYTTLQNLLILSDKPCNNFEIKINQLYSYEDLDKLINEILPTIKLPLNGLLFLPKYSGISYLFNENQNKVKVEFNQNSTINEPVKFIPEYDMIRDLSDYLSQRTYHYENFNKKKVFYLSKTDITDIYHLKDLNINDKIELALIPSLKISHQVKLWLTHQDKIKVECVYHNQFNKWIPITLIN